MKEVQFDFNNMFSFSIGKEHGVEHDDLQAMSDAASKAHLHLKKIMADRLNRISLNLEWTQLPFQDTHVIEEIKRLGKEIADKYENVISLGIGGSYLGIKAGHDALNSAYYNEFKPSQKGPRMYFEGNNLDPDTLYTLLKALNPKKTCVIVISKSGETTETKAAFMVVEAWLKKHVGARYGRHILVITDPESGSLRKKVSLEQFKDKSSFRSLPLLKGVGGRFSEFNMGLLHLALAGVDIQDVLAGAKDMSKRCAIADHLKNPACLYGLLHTILYRKKHKPIAILMPFSERLKSTADWYIQLLAESLGKKFSRKIEIKDGLEKWVHNTSDIVNVGRTPIAARGTNDLHSIQQNNIEGENNKVVTFIRVEKFEHDITIPGKNDLLAGRKYSQLMNLAQEATEWALVKESRPNCTIVVPEISPYYWGALVYFFELATAYEGELLNIDAFNQPGVEGYKQYMYYKLGKPGLSAGLIESIKKTPLIKKEEWVV